MALQRLFNTTYQGNETDLPTTLPGGSTFIARDTKKVYGFDSNDLPFLIGSASSLFNVLGIRTNLDFTTDNLQNIIKPLPSTLTPGNQEILMGGNMLFQRKTLILVSGSNYNQTLESDLLSEANSNGVQIPILITELFNFKVNSITVYNSSTSVFTEIYPDLESFSNSFNSVDAPKFSLSISGSSNGNGQAVKLSCTSDDIVSTFNENYIINIDLYYRSLYE